MTMARQRWQYLLLFLAYLAFSLAASKRLSIPQESNLLLTAYSTAPTTFCKCTCFSNSTIIPFEAYSPSEASNTNATGGRKPRSCNDCTKQFCLDADLSICSEATEENVFTLCFQRDSTKDQAVIFIFIFATVGLLAWAAIKPYVVQWRERTRAKYSYTPVAGERDVDGQ